MHSPQLDISESFICFFREGVVCIFGVIGLGAGGVLFSARVPTPRGGDWVIPGARAIEAF